MPELTLTDNTHYSTDIAANNHIDKNSAEQLLGIANERIKTLNSKYTNLIIWPQTSSALKGKFDHDHIIDITPHGNGLYDVHTGNVMGFLCAGNQQLTIKSRFDPDSNDFFVYYMLSRVFSLNLTNLQHNTSRSDSMMNLLHCLFGCYLHKALLQGIYRQYRTFSYNDANISGSLDIPRHIRNNVPFNGKAAYHKREFDYNNPINQLIRHTIEHIRKLPSGNAILQSSDELVRDIQTIERMTPDYRRSALREVILANQKPVRHAYYNEYAFLQRLCLQILKHEQMRYDTVDSEVFGVLFDGAWLWEEYLNTVLQEAISLKHPQNKEGKGRINLFEHKPAPRYPDFYNDKLVLDAKYKKMQGAETTDYYHIQRDDLHQLISYMYCLKLDRGGFIYPSVQDTASPPKRFKLKGYGGQIALFDVLIPRNPDNFQSFTQQIKQSEKQLIADIKKYLPKKP